MRRGPIRALLKRIRKSLRDRGRAVEGIFVAIIGGAILFGLIALVGYFVDSNPIAHIEDWLIVLIGVGALLLGGALGALGAADGSEGTDSKDQAKYAEEANKYKATSAYISHYRNTLASLLTGKLTISADVDKWGDEVGRLLCAQPRSLISDATGHDVGISVWLETADAAGNPRFKIVLDDNHSGTQTRKFETLKVGDTWLHYTATQQRTNPEESPVAARSLLGSLDGNEDLKMFKSMEYKEVRAFAVDLDGTCLRLVALTKTEHAFSTTEDAFFLLLWSVFAIAASPPVPDAD